MYQIDRFDDKTVRSLAGSTDPDVKTAVMFLLAYGDRNSPVRGQKVGFDVATAALSSPSPGIRKLASEVMLWNDPNDKKRIDRGYDALLQATLNPRQDAALDAVEALIPFAKSQMPEYGDDAHTLPDGTKLGFVEWLAFMLATAPNGTESEKIAFLNTLGKDSVMHYFDKWDELKEIFNDPNPKVRTAAFASAPRSAEEGKRQTD